MAEICHIDNFLTMLSVERGSSENTLEAYSRDLNSFSEFIIEEPSQANTRDIEDFISYLSKQGMSSKTIARKLSVLKQFFLYLYLEKIISANPTASIDAPKMQKSLPKFLSKGEVLKLLETAAQDARLSLMLELLYAAGLRVSELITLKVNSIRQEGEDFYVFIHGKGNKERVVPLGKPAMLALQKYLEENDNLDDWLFSSRDSHITRQRFGQMLKQLAIDAAIQPSRVSPHIIRHSFASHLLDNGADLRLVQELLGHEQIVTTQIYTHIQEEKLHEIVNNHHPLAD